MNPALLPKSLCRLAARRPVRILLALVAAVGVVSALALASEALIEARGRRLTPPPGALVRVGGHRLHLLCRGEGEPTVVLEAGMDSASFQWGWVQPEVARWTRVCAYDRSGYGWSEAGPGPHSAAARADELGALLDAAHIEGPVVLAAHSYGGLVARAFAARSPGRVAGLVLIDSSHPSQFDGQGCQPACLSAEWREVADRFQHLAPVLARTGLLRLGLGDRFGLFDWVKTLPASDARAIRERALAAGHWAAGAAEWSTFRQSAREARALDSLGDKPLVVVTAGSTYRGPEARRYLPAGSDGTAEAAAWAALQRDHLTLSTHASQVVVEEASHVSLVTRPDFARTVAEAIRGVVREARRRAAAGSQG